MNPGLMACPLCLPSVPALGQKRRLMQRVLLKAGSHPRSRVKSSPGEGTGTQEEALDIPLIPTFHVIFLKFLLVRYMLYNVDISRIVFMYSKLCAQKLCGFFFSFFFFLQ